MTARAAMTSAAVVTLSAATAGQAALGAGANTEALARPVASTAAPAVVDPTALGRGERPHTAFLRTDTKVIRHGTRRLSIRFPGEVNFFAVVRRGYLLGGRSRALGSWLAVYDRDGRRHLLARSRAGIGNVRVAPAGRRVAYHRVSSTGTHIVVRRVSDGARVADRTFRRETQVLAFGDRRLLLAQGANYTVADTTWWRLGRRRLGRYSSNGLAAAADLTGRQVHMTYGGSRADRMLSIPRDADEAWDVPLPGHAVGGPWAPGDRRVLFLSQFDSVDSWAYSRLDVLSHAGRRLRTFTGHFAGGFEPKQALAWEGDGTFLVLAYTVGADGTVDRGAVVRCRLRGPCERASGVYDVTYPHEVPYLLATPRTG